MEVSCTFILTWQFKKNLEKLCFPGDSSCVERVRFLDSSLFCQTVTGLWKVRTLTASLCCLWFYSWKAKCFIHHQEAFIKQHINKMKRIERRSIWGWVTAPDTTGSHSILPSGHDCAFDGWVYKVLRDPYSPLLHNFLGATVERWIAFFAEYLQQWGKGFIQCVKPERW